MLNSLDKLERSVFRSYWDDGLLDGFAALGVFLIGLFWIRDLPVAAAIVPALMAPLWKPLREKLIEPRLGMVEFSERREKRNRKSLQWVMYLGIASLILAIELYFARDSLKLLPATAFIAGLPAILLGLLAMITALLTGAYRFLLYTLVLITFALIGISQDWRPGLIMASAGSAMLVLAAVLMTRFFMTHPVTEGEGT